jgi:hypothetical protein
MYPSNRPSSLVNEDGVVSYAYADIAGRKALGRLLPFESVRVMVDKRPGLRRSKVMNTTVPIQEVYIPSL